MSKTNISDDQLLDYNRKGFIPGPGENEEDFIRRVKHLLNFSNETAGFLKKFPKDLPFRKTSRIPRPHLQEALKQSEQLFGFSPDWTPGFFDDTDLALWQGGAASVMYLENQSQPIAFMQLRQEFSGESKILGIYDRTEVMAHEMAHIGRMVFDEPRFEEVLAYQTSSNSFRRKIGPIVSSANESSLFMIVLMLAFALEFAAVYFDNPLWGMASLSYKAIPLSLIAFGVFRLRKGNQVFSGCREILEKILGDSSKALHVMYRLTDKEIEAFSEMSALTAQDLVHYNKKHSLRWRLIALAYFK